MPFHRPSVATLIGLSLLAGGFVAAAAGLRVHLATSPPRESQGIHDFDPAGVKSHPTIQIDVNPSGEAERLPGRFADADEISFYDRHRFPFQMGSCRYILQLT